MKEKVRNRIEIGKMLACTEMITMCLQSAKHEHLRKQQELDRNHNQGISLVQDVSRLYTGVVMFRWCYSFKMHILLLHLLETLMISCVHDCVYI